MNNNSNGNNTNMPKFVIVMREIDSTVLMLCISAIVFFILYYYKPAIIKDGSAGIIGIAGTVIGYLSHMVQSSWAKKNGNSTADASGETLNREEMRQEILDELEREFQNYV